MVTFLILLAVTVAAALLINRYVGEEPTDASAEDDPVAAFQQTTDSNPGDQVSSSEADSDRLGFWATIMILLAQSGAGFLGWSQGAVWLGWVSWFVAVLFLIGVAAFTEHGWPFLRGAIKGLVLFYVAAALLGVVALQILMRA